MSSRLKMSRPVLDTLPIHSTYSPKQRVQISFPQNSPYTKQEFKDESDINILMAKYISTGQLPDMREDSPQYLDATGYDYQVAMEFVAGANTLFHELPSTIRSRFGNNPAEFLDFCSHEKNRPEMAEMGLLKPQAAWVNTLAAPDDTKPHLDNPPSSEKTA